MRQIALIGFILYLMLMFLILSGCSSKYDDCLEKERETYRQRNPNASHAMMSRKQQEFEMMCSSLKGK
jgi:uncharacterized protein YceK